MFKKLLSAVGIGGATVDTRLETQVLQPGAPFRGEVLVQGGQVRQEVEGLELALVTRVEVEAGDQEYAAHHVMQSWRVTGRFTVEPDERSVFAFEGGLHPETPVTAVSCRDNRTQVWMQTGLAIESALDASDRDLLRVEPTPAMRAFLAAMQASGLVLAAADVEKGFLNASTFRSRSGCYQEFEFRPAGLGLGMLRQVEVSFVPEAHRTHVLLEVDRAFRGDGFRELTIDHDRIDERLLAARIREMVGLG